MVDRIQRGTAATISFTLAVDGTAENPSPDGATVTVTDSAGVVVVATTAATDTGTGAFSYNLTPTHTALLDTLTATWTYTRAGTTESQTTTHEIVGGFLFTLADLAGEVTASTTTYTAAQMANARTYAETELEQACGVAFVPRYTLETVSGHPTSALRLKSPVRAIRSVTVNGTPLGVSDLAGLYTSWGFVTGYTWPYGTGNIVVGYEHGLDYPSPGASEAALVLAKHKLVRGPIDERATQRPSEFGPVNLATPGMFGARFGIPVVDAFVTANNYSVGVA